MNAYGNQMNMYGNQMNMYRDPETMYEGTFIVRPVSASLLNDGDFLFGQDPYVVATIGNQKLKNQYHNRGGKTPVWKESLVFRIKKEKLLNLEVYDYDSFKGDDFLGACDVELRQLFTENQVIQTKTFNLKEGGTNAGTLTVEFEYMPKNPYGLP